MTALALPAVRPVEDPEIEAFERLEPQLARLWDTVFKEEPCLKETISREAAVGLIRIKMMELCGSGKSACQVAAERNILCKGFRRDSDEELHRRYAPYVDDADRMSRHFLERAANHWQLLRQRKEEVKVACDVQYRYYQACKGWNDFSNEQLSDFCFELAGVRPKVVGKITLPNI